MAEQKVYLDDNGDPIKGAPVYLDSNGDPIKAAVAAPTEPALKRFIHGVGRMTPATDDPLAVLSHPWESVKGVLRTMRDNANAGVAALGSRAPLPAPSGGGPLVTGSIGRGDYAGAAGEALGYGLMAGLGGGPVKDTALPPELPPQGPSAFTRPTVIKGIHAIKAAGDFDITKPLKSTVGAGADLLEQQVRDAQTASHPGYPKVTTNPAPPRPPGPPPVAEPGPGESYPGYPKVTQSPAPPPPPPPAPPPPIATQTGTGAVVGPPQPAGNSPWVEAMYPSAPPPIPNVGTGTGSAVPPPRPAAGTQPWTVPAPPAPTAPEITGTGSAVAPPAPAGTQPWNVPAPPPPTAPEVTGTGSAVAPPPTTPGGPWTAPQPPPPPVPPAGAPATGTGAAPAGGPVSWGNWQPQTFKSLQPIAPPPAAGPNVIPPVDAAPAAAPPTVAEPPVSAPPVGPPPIAEPPAPTEPAAPPTRPNREGPSAAVAGKLTPEQLDRVKQAIMDLHGQLNDSTEVARQLGLPKEFVQGVVQDVTGKAPGEAPIAVKNKLDALAANETADTIDAALAKAANNPKMRDALERRKAVLDEMGGKKKVTEAPYNAVDETAAPANPDASSEAGENPAGPDPERGPADAVGADEGGSGEGIDPLGGKKQRAADRRSRAIDPDKNLVPDLITKAQEDGFTGDPSDLRAHLQDQIDLIDEMDSWGAESGHDPTTLLRAIAKYGGLSIFEEEGGAGHANAAGMRGMGGELRRLQEFQDNHGTALHPQYHFGTVRGVKGVFNKSGLSLDDMLSSLQQDAKFSHLESINDLVGELEDAARAAPDATLTQKLQRAGVEYGGDWWKHLQDAGDEPITFDANEFGEQQDRLPEAGAVRDVEVKTPELEAPFSLHGGADMTPKETQGSLGDLLRDALAAEMKKKK